MEKNHFGSTVFPRTQQLCRTEKVKKWISIVLITTLVLFWWTYGRLEDLWPTFGASSTKLSEFRWSQIKPSHQLIYTSCFGIYQCARLSVPMDWNSTSPNAAQVTIAIMKIPAPVSVTDHRYRGPILLNPGGPGGSGVDFMLRDGAKISQIVNSPQSPERSREGQYFDLLTFDPRGVNNTTPRLECFPDSLSYDVWRYQEEAEGINYISDAPMSLAWARAKALMGLCSQVSEISKHMNTVPVVRDMVEIIEKHGEWRSKQAEIWLASKEGRSTTNGKKNDDLYSREGVIERTKWHQGDEKLQYWGFSYGTLLGGTFAAINPQRVGRVILDGVVDAKDYYGTVWRSNLNDTDKIMLKFYEYCSEAGPQKCALNVNNSTSSEIQKSVESLVASLREDPLPVAGNATRGPEIITYSDVLMMLRKYLYVPLYKFPEMAELLADLVYGNGSAFAEFKQNTHKPTCPLSESRGNGVDCKGEKQNYQSCQPPAEGETTRAILCSDGIDLTNSTKEDFRQVLNALHGQSKWMGEFWSSIPMPCMHWKARPKWSIAGDDIKGRTSHPILWIGNTLDTVTPLANAHIMSKRFPGSGVLQQDSEGHVSLSSPSVCTHEVVRKYFQTGDLPAPGTVCQPDKRPLIGHVGSSEESRPRQNEAPLIWL